MFHRRAELRSKLLAVLVTAAVAVGGSIGPAVPVVSAAGYEGMILGDSPVGYWRLGDANGVTAADELTANPGTYAGGITLGVAGALSGETGLLVDALPPRWNGPYPFRLLTLAGASHADAVRIDLVDIGLVPQG